MGWPSHRPRCLMPMEYRSSVEDPDPVCWRPKGHTPNRHLSRQAYLNELERSRKNRRNYDRDGHRKMSDPPANVAGMERAS